MSELTKLFQTITAIDSPSGEEQKVSDYVFNYLKELGLEPVQDKQNMIYCRVGKGENPKLFCAHLDTVEPGRGVEVIERHGFLVSKGDTIIGGDNKVAVAAILQSTKELLTEGKEINVELLFSVREETDSGVQEFDHHKLESKVGYVFDFGPDLESVALTAPFITDFGFTITGEAAHASTPEEGVNALEVLLRSGLRIGRLDEETTFNIGLINGGTATNTVPRSILLKGDLRSLSEESYNSAKNEIEQKLNEAAKELNAQLDILWKPYSYGYVLDANSDNFKKTAEVYKQFAIDLVPVDSTSGSDAGFLNHIGIETFNLGSGVEAAHTTDERVSIEIFEMLSQIVQELMVS